jgi:hypothetical protein
MVRNAPSGDRSPPAWRRGTKFFKQNYPDHECSGGKVTSSSVNKLKLNLPLPVAGGSRRGLFFCENKLFNAMPMALRWFWSN